MATQSVFIVATLAWSLLVVPLWFGAADSLKPPCQKQPRHRKPPHPDTLLWQGYWVPLMILLGGFCALAWCILFVAYDVHQRGSKELSQLPSEEEPVPVLPEAQKETSRLLFRAESNMSSLGIGNYPWMENQQETSEGLKSMIDLERKSKSNNLVDERTRSILQLETKAMSQNLVLERSRSIIELQKKATSQSLALERSKSIIQLQKKATSQSLALERSPSIIQLEKKATSKSLVSERSPSTIQLERKATSKSLVSERSPSTIQLERKATSKSLAPERSPSVIQLERKSTSKSLVSQRIPSVTQLVNNITVEKIGSSTQLESNLKRQLEGPVTVERNRGVTFFQEELEMVPQRFGQAEEENNPSLWSFMEKELENLLKALRLRQPAQSMAPVEMETPGPSTEDKSVGPEIEMSSPLAPETSPRPPAELPSNSPRMEENQSVMQVIICEIPSSRSRSRSPTRGRGHGRKRRCTSRKRK